jgi:hypothetical protein
MPLFVVLPLVPALAWGRLRDTLGGRGARLLGGGLVAATLGLIVASVEVDNAPPYIRSSVLEARQIGTHDGRRSWGAYAAQIAQLARLDKPDGLEEAGGIITDALVGTPGLSVVVVGEDNVFYAGGAGWRHAQLALARRGYPGTVPGPGLMRIDAGESRLWLARDLEAVPPEAREGVIVMESEDGIHLEGLEGLPRLP